MIKSWRHRGLRELFQSSRSAKVAPALQKRAFLRLSTMNSAKSLSDLDQPGFDFHRLRGSPVRYTIHINGPWCITFGWDGVDATDVDLEQYH